MQQNSDTTYRIYDFGRVGADGKPRELHLEQALEVIEWDDTEGAKVAPQLERTVGRNELWQVLHNPYFRMEKLVLAENFSGQNDGSSFHALFCARGSATVSGGEEAVQMRPGMSLLLPAGLGEYLIDTEGAEIMRISVPASA